MFFFLFSCEFIHFYHIFIVSYVAVVRRLNFKNSINNVRRYYVTILEHLLQKCSMLFSIRGRIFSHRCTKLTFFTCSACKYLYLSSGSENKWFLGFKCTPSIPFTFTCYLQIDYAKKLFVCSQKNNNLQAFKATATFSFNNAH